MVLMNLCARQQRRCGCRELTCGLSRGRREWDEWREQNENCEVKVKIDQSCPTLCDPVDYTVHGILQARILAWTDFPFLQGIFPTQASNPSLPYGRQILYQLGHQECPTCTRPYIKQTASGSWSYDARSSVIT